MKVGSTFYLVTILKFCEAHEAYFNPPIGPTKWTLHLSGGNCKTTYKKYSFSYFTFNVFEFLPNIIYLIIIFQ